MQMVEKFMLMQKGLRELERTEREIYSLRTRSGEPLVKFIAHQTASFRSLQSVDPRQNVTQLRSLEFNVYKTSTVSATDYLLKDLPISLVEREFVQECEKVTTIGENNYMGIKCIGDTRVAVSIQSLPFKPERGRQNRGDVLVELLDFLVKRIFIADPDERKCLFVDEFVLIGVTEKDMVFAVREDGDQVKTTKEKMFKLCDSALNRAKQMDSKLKLYFKDSRLL